MSKKKIAMLDTNVYGLGIEDSSVKTLLERLAVEKEKGVIEILSSDTILKEIRKTGDRNLRGRLREYHDSVAKGVIKLSINIKNLANQYFDECKKRKIKVTLADCEIVAAATFVGVNQVVSNNRKTMTNPDAIKVYEIINKSKGLKMPHFANVQEAIKWFS